MAHEFVRVGIVTASEGEECFLLWLNGAGLY